MTSTNLLIFTDMDGSLLDHYTYSHAAADDLLKELENLGIPVIANTSKTQAELEQLRIELTNEHPFIAENGAAVFIPKKTFTQQPPETKSQGSYWVKEFSKPREHWQNLIAETGSEFVDSYTTFEQAGLDGIIEMTGLSEENAKLAANRGYGEPLKWNGSEQDATQFFSLLEARGANILKGGRFCHVSGHSDKGVALRWLTEQYKSQNDQQSSVRTVAIGDSQNDVAMLDESDYAIVVKSPTHTAPKLHTQEYKMEEGRLYYSEAYGPEGWAEGMSKLLLKLGVE